MVRVSGCVLGNRKRVSRSRFMNGSPVLWALAMYQQRFLSLETNKAYRPPGLSGCYTISINYKALDNTEVTPHTVQFWVR